jgi:EmrB/QacA subfamily drug resistance transporter
MAFIDGSVVTIALPAIQANLASNFQELQWVVNGYTLMLGALLLVGGGLGDRLGRRRVFIAGIVVFALASVACAVAASATVLIAARIVQGIGAAALVPQSLAIISASFPKEVRGAAIGTWAAASAVTTALGPVLGGFLIDSFSWRVAFWINPPIAVAAIWLALRYVPENRETSAAGRIDWPGAAVAVGGLGALTLGLTILSDAAGRRLLAFGLLAAGLAAAVPFLAIERRSANPIMPLELFRSRVFVGANVVTLFLYGSLSGVLFLLPFDLIERRGFSAAAVGLTLLPFGLIIGVGSRFAGKAADRIGPRPFLSAGSLLVCVGAAGLAVGASDYAFGVLLPVLFLSAGMAIAVSPLTTAVMNSVDDSRSGAASGVNNAASRLAGLLAVALVALIAENIFRWLAPDGARFGVLPEEGAAARAALESAFLVAYRTAMAVAALSALLAATGSHLLLKRPSEKFD